MRAVKARKWIYLTSALGAVLAHRLYDEEATKALIKVAGLPAWLLSQATGFALLYLFIQYILLLEQLRSVYDLELAERFAAKLQAERTAAQSVVEGAAASLSTLDRERLVLENRKDALEEAIKKGLPYSPTERESLQSQFDAALSNRLLADQNLRAADDRVRSIDERDPAKRNRFVLTERLIDLLRLSAPVVVALVVLVGLLFAQF